MNEALKLGVVLGLVSIASTVVMSFLSTDVIFSMKSFVISLTLTSVVLIAGGRYFLRRIPDIDLSYGVAVKYLFVAALVGSIIGLVVAALVFGNNEDMKTAFAEYQVASMEYGIELAGKMSGSEESVQIAKDEIREKIDSGELDLADGYPYQISKLPMNIAGAAVMSLIYALIYAIFVRVKHPD